MRYIDSEKKRKHTYFVLSFPFSEDVIDKVRKIPSADFDGKTKKWYVKVCRETAPYIFKLITSYEFEASDFVLNKIQEIITSRKELKKLSRASNSDIQLPEFPGELEPYGFQRAGADYMIRAKRCFNGDDMGLGKTIQAIIAMEAVEAYPHIVICPATVKEKWKREIQKWLPNRSVAILNDNNFSYHYDVMILNYEVVLKYLVREKRRSDKNNLYRIREQIKRIDVQGVTVDESHKCKNPKSKRTKAVKKLCRGREYVWLLSGTIIENRPKEIISQLQIIDRLWDLGGYQHFIKEYCDAEMEWHGNMNKDGASNLGKLNKKLRQTCLVRRLKDDILDELPSKSRQNIPVKIDNMEEYEIAENNVFDWMEMEREKKRGNDLFGNKYDEDIQMVESAIELQIINALKLITARGKVKAAIKWIKKFLKTGKKLVVFAHHKEIQKEILRHFPSSAKILGGMSSAEKDRNEQVFNNEDACQLIVCSMKAANEGIDLLSAHNGLFVELAWKPSTHDQAEDREWRLGQKHDVKWYYLLGKNTIDEDIYELLDTKREIASASLDGSKDGEDSSILNDLVNRLNSKGKLKIPKQYEGDTLI